MSHLAQLKPVAGSTKKRKRVGRGPGSGHGKTSCRGSKGQNARSGGGVPPGFEGGQMPLKRRLPKRGFTNPFRRRYAIVSLQALAVFEGGMTVDVPLLIQRGLVKKTLDGVKILGNGDIKVPLIVKVHCCSEGARRKIEAAGGRVEEI